MKKILVIGCTGMLGWQVLRSLQNLKNFKIYATYKNNYKLSLLKKNLKINKNVIFKKYNIEKKNNIKHLNFKYIINCVGIIKPYIDEKNQNSIVNAIKINSLFPNYLVLNNKKSKIFQIATDCVYDGRKGNYIEHDNHNPEDVYGKTKSLGELKYNNFYNIRCSIIGPELNGHKSLLDWFRLMPLKSKVFGYKNHSWNGITTYAFGKIICAIIKNNLNIPNAIHLLPKNVVNKYQLLKIFKKYFSRQDIKIKSKNSHLYINRTINTIYKDINKKVWKLAGYKTIPTIENLVKELID